MSKTRQLLRLPVATALALAAASALATNGMNMEGYGPISTAMGGTSQAIDHGTAGMAQNPATLALGDDRTRLDLAFGLLGPNVRSEVPNCCGADSGGTSYVMPAFGYVRRSNGLTYGLGIFAQGGMGTEYDANSFIAMGSGKGARSELGVGRVLLPLAMQVTPDLAIGGSLDFVWATLDLGMAASGAELGGLVTSASGNLAMALGGLGAAPWARLDFSDDSDFSGAAKGTGFAFKLGMVYKASPDLNLGASYQSKTQLKDMRTGTRGAAMTAFGGFADAGRMTVVDFQWPEMYGLGAAWKVSSALTLAGDVKRIGWSDVMSSFRMRYDSAGMGGSVSFALPQMWKDQTVLSIGGAYALNEALTLRAGYNHGGNPVPDLYVNPLFPATVENHLTAGMGYKFSPTSELNMSLTVAPESKSTSGGGVVITHSQTNAQLMYTARF